MAPFASLQPPFEGCLAIFDLTEDEVWSWNSTQLYTALFEYQLLNDTRFNNATEKFRGRLVAHVHAQAVVFQALSNW